MNKKIIICLSILLMVFLSVIGALSYAYFSASVNTSNAAIVNTTLPNGSYTFTTTNAGSINISFSSNKMLSSAVSTTAISSGNTNIEVSLTSPDASSRVVCTYDLVWEWTSTDKYTTSDVGLPYNTSYKYEMSVQANSTTTESPSGVSYGYDNQLNETDLSEFTWSSSKATILSGASIVSASKTTPTVTKWNITQKIYNLPVAQPKLQGKSFKSKVYASNIDCNIVPLNPLILSGNLNTNGSEVQIGTENFYVLGTDESNSSNVKLLAKYNLLVGYIMTNVYNENLTQVAISNSTQGYNMQSSSSLGKVNDKANGTIAFSSTNYWHNSTSGTIKSQYGSSYSSYPYVYDSNSNLYKYVEKYKTLMNQRYGANISIARLITFNEGFNIYTTNWGSLTSYWTGSLYDNQNLWGIAPGGSAGGTLYYKDYCCGIRPVIIVPKSIFS